MRTVTSHDGAITRTKQDRLDRRRAYRDVRDVPSAPGALEESRNSSSAMSTAEQLPPMGIGWLGAGVVRAGGPAEGSMSIASPAAAIGECKERG